MRERLESTGSTRKKRKVTIDSEETSCDDDDGFELPDWQKKRDARQSRNSVSQLVNENVPHVSNSSPRPRNTTRPQQQRATVWGKAKINNIASFRGITPKVPQVFVSKCHPE